MKIILFEDQLVSEFYPFALTRHVAQLRWGAKTIQEKWGYFFSEVLLQSNRPLFNECTEQDAIWVNARFTPTPEMLHTMQSCADGIGFKKSGQLVAFKGASSDSVSEWKELDEIKGELSKKTDLFSQLSDQLKLDIEISGLTPSSGVEGALYFSGPTSDFYCDPTAKIRGAIFNTEEGPIWIDAHAEVMEGSVIRGPFYLGNNSVIKMGAKVYGPSAIGPHCKVGGEIGNVSFQGYSNKAHDGFLGNSVIGNWCNLGADTNCSNLKNNYSVVKHYNYTSGSFESTGLNFCGLMMGDYSKCGINTMWNTGSVTGVCVNFYGAGFPSKFLPDFYWGDAEKGELYDLKKAIETIEIVMSRRGMSLSDRDRKVLTELHEKSTL
jgi:UDP-N-acetylglucosamine diphosphorylase/glucosamine-1-phosphate N-acetyltransferase